VEHTFFSSARWLGPFELLYFTVIVNLYGFWRWLCRKPRPATIIHATCGTYLGADVTSVHFLGCVWARTQLRIGFSGWRDVARYSFTLLGMCVERLQWWSPALRLALAVSDSVAAEVRTRTRSAVGVETLPNSYDETRFNPGVRDRQRPAFREQFGFHTEDVVFVFASFGHYKRKGFWLAVSAIAAARAAGCGKKARLLVLGGAPRAISVLESQLGAMASDWKDWITFAGPQTAMENYYAAGDALIFPSYFETYGLVALEAAAMGLPVLLTPFHGSEMTLCDGVNGRLLSYDPVILAGQIRDFLANGLPGFQRSVGRGLTKGEYTAALVGIYERMTVGRGI
jgi:glycosyltransferase involved in cell wall biosynthesis